MKNWPKFSLELYSSSIRKGDCDGAAKAEFLIAIVEEHHRLQLRADAVEAAAAAAIVYSSFFPLKKGILTAFWQIDFPLFVQVIFFRNMDKH